MNFLEAILYLALNLYHEGRGLEELDQLAIAHVVINRAEQQGKTIRQVVLQPYQFSWTTQEDYTLEEAEALLLCEELARVALNGVDFTGGATHYHLETVIPEWTNRMQYIASFGPHKFYRER